MRAAPTRRPQTFKEDTPRRFHDNRAASLIPHPHHPPPDKTTARRWSFCIHDSSPAGVQDESSTHNHDQTSRDAGVTPYYIGCRRVAPFSLM